MAQIDLLSAYLIILFFADTSSSRIKSWEKSNFGMLESAGVSPKLRIQIQIKIKLYSTLALGECGPCRSWRTLLLIPHTGPLS